MNQLLAFVLCTLIPTAQCMRSASASKEWCYHKPNCSDSFWPGLFPQYCNGSRQSPINIVSASATADSSLTSFTFHNFSSTSAFDKIKNTGKTIKVTLKSGVQVSGGGLSEAYDGLQFHLHWGNGSTIKGAEHTVDGKRYPMELHIVNIKSSYNGNTTLGIADSTGLAALGFFIEEMSGNATNSPASWHTLTSYLSNITEKDQYVKVGAGISLDDLLAGVNLKSYYRYLGSLTTPSCNEAVVWTVFKEPIKVSKDLIDLFSNTVRIGDNSSILMTKNYRNLQPDLPVSVTTTSSSASKTCYSLGLMFLSLLLRRGST